MGASPFALRTTIIALIIGCGAVQILFTFRKSLRLSLFLDDAPIPKTNQHQHQYHGGDVNDGDDDGKPRFNKAKNNITNSRNTTAAADDGKETPTESEISAVKRRKQRPQPGLKPLSMEEVKHFLSHIPKSGTEYAHRELIHLLQSTIRLPSNRSIASVRTAQKRFNRTGYQGNFLKANNAAEQAMPIPLNITGDTDGYTPPMICNQGTTPFAHLKPYYVGRGVRFRCDFFVTEKPWNSIAKNVYTIVREPFSHILSQYFHCTESRDHKTKREHMPSLEEWLESFANLTEAKLSDKQREKKVDSMRRSFKCYNPTNSESEFTKFDRRLPENYTFPYPYTENEDNENKKLDNYLFDDLKRRYRIIGDTSRMIKTVCAIFISYTDGEHIPEICDCTNPRIVDGSSKESDQFYVPNLQKDPHGEKKGPEWQVQIGYNSIEHSHGVAHHGSSFLKELTPYQRGLIAKIRKKDQVLYNVSRAVFDEQIAEMEAAYGIKVCDDWNRPTRVKSH